MYHKQASANLGLLEPVYQASGKSAELRITSLTDGPKVICFGLTSCGCDGASSTIHLALALNGKTSLPLVAVDLIQLLFLVEQFLFSNKCSSHQIL